MAAVNSRPSVDDVCDRRSLKLLLLEVVKLSCTRSEVDPIRGKFKTRLLHERLARTPLRRTIQ